MIPSEELEKKMYGSMDTIEHRVVDKYIRANKMHRKVLEKNLNKSGVFRSQHQILMFVCCHPNASQKEIAKLHNVSTATVAVSLKKLEKGGYIKRVVDEADNRFNQICITKKGSEVVEKSINFFRSVECGMFDGFSEPEMEQFAVYIDRIYENMKKMLQQTESEEQHT